MFEGRVGSTLLMQLLASSPEVALDRRYPIGEYRYLSYCVRAADRIAAPFDPQLHPDLGATFFGAGSLLGPLPFDAQSLDREVLRRRAIAHLWEAMSEAMIEQNPGVVLYAEKLAVPLSDVIDAAVPVQLVDLVRDPRDVLASIRSFSERIGPVGFDRRAGEPELEYLERFVTKVARGIDLIGDVPSHIDHRVLRYEDVATDLRSTAVALSSWLGVELDADTVDRQRADFAEHITTESVADSIGRWRTDLHADDASTIWNSLGRRLDALGYEQ